MHAFLSYIVILLSLLMFVVKREHKICILLIYLLCLNGVYAPTLKGVLLPQVFFFLSEIRYFKQYVNIIKGTRFKYPLVILLVGIVILWINSPHMTGPSGLFALFSYDFIRKYGIFFFVFIACLGCKNQKAIIKVTFIYLLVLTSFGILNLLTKHAIYVDWVLAGLDADSVMGDAGSKFTYEDRFRVQAMFANPFDYGYICVLIMLLHIYGYTRKMENKITFLITMICSGFGIFTCGCRTILFCFLIGISVYSLLAFKASKSLRIVLFLAFLIPVSYQTIPPVQEQIDKMMTMFEKNSDVGGSSVELRTLQYTTVLWYIQDSPWFGRGYGFFSQDLGWSKGSDYAMDSRLAGMEGVAMNKLLERGFIGLLLYAVFWISLIIFMFKNRSVSSPLTALGLSILAVYLSFANMTGELLSVYPTLLLLGFTIKAIEVKKVVPPPIRNLPK